MANGSWPAVVTKMAALAGVDEKQFYDTIVKTVMPSPSVSNEQFLAFLQVANQYNLNPFTKEVYAFPAKGGGIQPVVSIDGWIKLANSQGDFDGMTHDDVLDDDGNLVAVTCSVYRAGRTHPVTATEYMAECKRQTEPWKNWPRRMLRHKATIQALRYAFGFAGIIEPDEAERYHHIESQVVVDSQVNGSATDALKSRLGLGCGGNTEHHDEATAGSSGDISSHQPEESASYDLYTTSQSEVL